MNIVTHTSRTYHTPCEVQSVEIAASFAAWVIMAVVIVTSAVVVVVATVVVAEVLLVVAITLNFVLVDVNANIFAVVMTAFEFAIPPGPLESRC